MPKMNIRFASIVAIVLLFTFGGVFKPQAADEKPRKEIRLYPGDAPGSEKWDWSERSLNSANGLPMVQDVVRPVLLHYPVDRSKATGAAMIVAPGGGFRTLMMSYEGTDIARRLNEMGIEAFVLKYRLIYNGPDAPRAPGSVTSAPGERPVIKGAFKGQSDQDMVGLAIDDGRAAVQLVRERASEFDIRTNRVGMIGFSA